jgi:hypothetical protein
MKRTYITDILHFLDGNGEIIQDGGPVPKIASFMCLIIDNTTSHFPAEELNTGIRCKRSRCKGSIYSSLFEKHEEIFWFCP